jgi:uncharacterized membrane protein YfcA
MDFLLFVLGFFIGILVGVTGVGGASLLTPILIFMGLNPIQAVGTDLAYNSITKFFGVLQHWRQKSIKLDVVKYLAIGSVPCSILAVFLGQWIYHEFEQAERWFKFSVGTMLVMVSVIAIFRVMGKNSTQHDKHLRKRPLHNAHIFTVVIGGLLGFIVGFTSIGSGSLFALAIYYLYSVSGKELVGTDLFHAFILTTVTGIFHFGFGTVQPDIVLQLVMGSIPGVVIGSKLTNWVPTQIIRLLVLVTILISGSLLIFQLWEGI